jgi:hypothetical protein
VSGINLEDSHVVDSTRRLDDAERFAVKTRKSPAPVPVCLLMSAPIPFFSTYKMRWFKRSIAVTLRQTRRMRFFVPCVTRAEDITAIVHHVPLPLNVMCMPELADFSTLSTLGVNEFRWAILFMLRRRPD